MDDDWSGSDNDSNDEEGSDKSDRMGDPKQVIILLIDFSESMFIKSSQSSPFELAMKCVHQIQLEKARANEKDQIGIIFYGTKVASGYFNNVYVFQEPTVPGANDILKLESAMEDYSLQERLGHSICELGDVLWFTQKLFKDMNRKNRVLIFTCSEDPYTENSNAKNKAFIKAKDLKENNIDISVVPLVSDVGQFDVCKFYEGITSGEPDKVEVVSIQSGLEALIKSVQRKISLRRVEGRVMLNIGKIKIQVSIHSPCRPMPKGRFILMDSQTNQELKTLSRKYCEATGKILPQTDVLKFKMFCGEKVVFEKEEVTGMKVFGPPGIELLGFKESFFVRSFYHIKPSKFITLDGKTPPGDTSFFSTLVSRCANQGVVGVCRYIPRRNSAPSLVALVPEMSGPTPAGFHMVFLPFSEDFRLPNFWDMPKATEEQVKKTKEMVSVLTIPYSPEDYINPALKMHTSGIEALALNRADREPFVDSTEVAAGRTAQLLGDRSAEFQAVLYPEEASGDVSESKQHRGIGSEEHNIALLFKNDQLQKLSVAQLCKFVNEKGLQPQSKRKADLMAEVQTYFKRQLL